MQFTPTLPVFSFHQEKAKVKERTFGVGDDEDASWMETEAVQEKGLGLVRDGNENINLEVNRYYFRLSKPIFPLLLVVMTTIGLCLRFGHLCNRSIRLSLTNELSSLVYSFFCSMEA